MKTDFSSSETSTLVIDIIHCYQLEPSPFNLRNNTLNSFHDPKIRFNSI